MAGVILFAGYGLRAAAFRLQKSSRSALAVDGTEDDLIVREFVPKVSRLRLGKGTFAA